MPTLMMDWESIQWFLDELKAGRGWQPAPADVLDALQLPSEARVVDVAATLNEIMRFSLYAYKQQGMKGSFVVRQLGIEHTPAHRSVNPHCRCRGELKVTAACHIEDTSLPFTLKLLMAASDNGPSPLD